MNFEFKYHPAFVKDLKEINLDIQRRIKAAIETRLGVAPEQYGAPLQRTLKGYWKLRVGDYRIVFRVRGNTIEIYGVIHRKKVYEKITKRLS